MVVAVAFGRNFRTFSDVSSGQVVEWPLLMALILVEVVGLKQAAWRNLMSSLVLVEVAAALADGCSVVAGAGACKSRYQRPLAWRVP